jgi:hypothetical protein
LTEKGRKQGLLEAREALNGRKWASWYAGRGAGLTPERSRWSFSKEIFLQALVVPLSALQPQS